jgi:hypothetical protein
LRRLLVGQIEKDRLDEQDRCPESAPPAGGIGRVAQFSVIDVIGPVAADILLSEEAGGTQRLEVVWIGRRKQLTYERQRPLSAAPCLLAAGRVARNGRRSAAALKITRIRRLLGYFP